MKRIVFAVTNDLTFDRRMQRICATLQTSGYEVSLIGRTLKASQPLTAAAFHQHRMKCFFNQGPLFYAEYNIRLFFYLLRSRAEIFGACDLDTALAVVLAGKLRHRQRVFDAHEHFAEVPEVERRPMVRRIWHAIGRWTIPHFHKRYTVGSALAGILEKAYAAPFEVVRNVPRLNRFPVTPIEQRVKRIVYVGALNEGRGLEQAIEAMTALPDFELKLIGEGDLSAQLRQLAITHHVADRVEFTGLVTPDRLQFEMSGAMVALNLLVARSKSYYYSLANKFFDYVQAGVPSVNMAFPEYLSIIDDYRVGICIDTLSAHAIAETIVGLTSSPETMQAMIAACRNAGEIFHWEREKQHLTAIFDKLDP